MKNLNQQVKRNIVRFPEDFMFQLTREEIESVKSQIVISRENNFFEDQGGGRRTLPYAFTEQGIYMLATVLRGELAEQQSIYGCKVIGDNIYKALIYFENFYDKMNEGECSEFTTGLPE